MRNSCGDISAPNFEAFMMKNQVLMVLLKAVNRGAQIASKWLIFANAALITIVLMRLMTFFAGLCLLSCSSVDEKTSSKTCRFQPKSY